MRCDGVNAGATFDDAYVVGGLWLLWNFEVGDGGYDATQAVYCTWRSECSIGMTAWATYCNAPAFGADGDMGDVAKTAIDGDDCTQLLLVAFDSSACAEEISQTFLAHVGNGDD